MTIEQLLKMPVGEKIGGGFILTVKTTKKSVQLPKKRYIHTVILFDNTGEMLADFKDPTIAGYNPLIKGQQIHIIVAEIQSADPTSNKIALKEAKKLFVDQYEEVKSNKSETDYYTGDNSLPDWETITKGKIRHGLVCSFIRANKEIDVPYIEALVKYIFTGELK